jgi:hypothetical protein
MVGAPELATLFPQLLLIEFADLFQDLPNAIEILQLLTDLSDLRGMEAGLAGLGTRVIDVEDVLEMAASVGAGRAGNGGGMEGAALEERAAQERIEWWERSDQLADAGWAWGDGLSHHLYR